MEDKTKLGIGIFVLLATVGTTYFIASEDAPLAYSCEDVVGLCFKLSAVNDDGLQTRCYYNESSPRRYKVCNSGWTSYAESEFIPNQLPTEIEPAPIILNELEIKEVTKENNKYEVSWCFHVDINSAITEICEVSLFNELPNWEEVEKQIKQDAQMQLEARLPQERIIEKLEYPYIESKIQLEK